jgi:hypothetical protein
VHGDDNGSHGGEGLDVEEVVVAESTGAGEGGKGGGIRGEGGLSDCDGDGDGDGDVQKRGESWNSSSCSPSLSN